MNVDFFLEINGKKSDWLFLKEIAKVTPAEAGVYIIRALAPDNDIPLCINRAIRNDCNGIIYCGETESLQDRIGRLSWICEDNIKEHQHHTFIETWCNYDLKRLVEPRRLQVKWCCTKQHKELEKDILENYKKAFGDLPPGNCRI